MWTIFQLNKRTIGNLFRTYRRRIIRLVIHSVPFVSSDFKLKSNGILEWSLDLMFYVADLLLLPDMYEIVSVWINKNIRLLTDYELKLAEDFFDKSIDFSNVRINSRMPSYVKKKAHAYVSFHTINFLEDISQAIFIHELVHIWQYQKYGSIYIYRALKAQRSTEGYQYGGEEGLYQAMIQKKKFIDFNFEQQGEIFEDYCRIRQRHNTQYSPISFSMYEYFIRQVR